MALTRQPTSLWQNRDYLLLWSGQLVSTTGSGISQIAFPLLALAVTGSPAQAGLVSALRSLSYVLFTLPAGALLDRWDRKRFMIICDIGRALCLVSIPLALALGQLTIIQIYIVAFVSGTLGVFFDIAELACLPQVVAKEQLPRVVGRTQAAAGVMNLVGPPLGGALFTLRSFLPFLVDAVSYVVSACSLFLIRVPFQKQREAPARKLGLEIGEGLRWLWNQPLLRTMALLTAGNVFCGAGFTLIVIVAAQQHHASDATIGLIFGIGGLGGVLGALIAGRVQQRFSFAQVIVVALWLYAAFWLLLATLPSPFLLGLITALLFFIGPFYGGTHISRRLAITPDTLQSRVNSVSRLIGLGLSPLGQALTGLLLQNNGPQVTILLSAGAQILLALIATVTPHIRHAPPLNKLTKVAQALDNISSHPGKRKEIMFMTATLPQGFIIRPATLDDLNAIAELLIACERADYGESESTLESTAAWILSVWQCPGFTLEKDSFVVIAPGDRCAGYVTVWHPENDLTELVASPRVHPDYCGLGIGTYLLRHAEVRARELMTNAPPDARVALYTWVDGGNQMAPHLVVQEGFTLLRYFLQMEIEMDAPPPVPTWLSGITVRTFSPGEDDRAVFDTTEDAFQDEPGYEPGNFAEWSYWLFTRDNFDPSLWFLAVDGDEIAGTALCRHDIGDSGGIGWISDVGVRPRWRKRGLGLALLQHAFGEFYRRGVRKCSLSVDVQNLSGAIRLYERAGMHPSRRAEIRYEKELRPGAEPRA